MKLSKEVEKFLIGSNNSSGFCPDESDIKMSDLLGNWRKMKKVDLGLIGVPFDTTTMYRPGSRLGPNSIRDNGLIFFNTYEPGLDCNLEGLKIADFGNIDVVYTDVLETHRRMEVVFTEIIKQGITPLILGGDHGCTYPHVKALLNNVKGNVGVINIDGHMDVRKNHHGMISAGTSFYRLIEEPDRNPVLPKNLVEIGINGWLASKSNADYCKEKGITYFSAREVHKNGITGIVNKALEKASKGTEAIWLSVDIDALDGAYAPGTNCPNPGGLTSYQVLEAIWMIGQHPLCRGMDLLEVSPPWDVQNLTSLLAASLCMNFIGATKKRLYG